MTDASRPEISLIENSDKRQHFTDVRHVTVRWEPYKADGRRQMKAKGRWQEQVGSGDYWRWQNCDRPAFAHEPDAADLAQQAPRVKPLVWSIDDDYIRAESPSGSYGINVWKSAATGVVSRIEMDGENHLSLEAAKAAAQADYEARILSALDLTPDPKVAALVEAAMGIDVAGGDMPCKPSCGNRGGYNHCTCGMQIKRDALRAAIAALKGGTQ